MDELSSCQEKIDAANLWELDRIVEVRVGVCGGMCAAGCVRQGVCAGRGREAGPKESPNELGRLYAEEYPPD